MQNQFWNELTKLKFRLFYLEEYLNQSHKFDSLMNIITAVTSSSSIGAWVIWNRLKFIWSLLIAISQVISATKAYLPFNKRTKFLYPLSSELSRLYIDYEHNWTKIAEGQMSINEINDLLKKLRSKALQIEDTYLLNNYLPPNNSLVKKAEKRNEEYFSAFYGV